jgi:hypothetical protein
MTFCQTPAHRKVYRISFVFRREAQAEWLKKEQHDAQYPGMKALAASNPCAALTLYPSASNPVNGSNAIAFVHASLFFNTARSIDVPDQMRVRKKGAASGVVAQDSRPCRTTGLEGQEGKGGKERRGEDERKRRSRVRESPHVSSSTPS